MPFMSRVKAVEKLIKGIIYDDQTYHTIDFWFSIHHCQHMIAFICKSKQYCSKKCHCKLLCIGLWHLLITKLLSLVILLSIDQQPTSSPSKFFWNTTSFKLEGLKFQSVVPPDVYVLKDGDPSQRWEILGWNKADNLNNADTETIQRDVPAFELKLSGLQDGAKLALQGFYQIVLEDFDRNLKVESDKFLMQYEGKCVSVYACVSVCMMFRWVCFKDDLHFLWKRS